MDIRESPAPSVVNRRERVARGPDVPQGGHVVGVERDVDRGEVLLGARGLEPAGRETYSNGVRKATYRDDDGNEIGFGGAPRDA